MSRFSRRELLGGAALAGAAALGCSQKKDPYRIEKPSVPGSRGRVGEERWVLSTCALCEAGCGIKVRVVEGRAVKIEGNPEHPVNRGGLCSRGQAALQLLYHPERVRSPLRRAGARGEGKWKPISWDEAIRELAAILGDGRIRRKPERMVLLDGGPDGFTRDLWARFMSVFGSPNHIDMETARLAAVGLAGQYMLGRYGLPAYDLDRTRLVLAMGAELLESSGQAMSFMRAAREPAANGRGRRLRVVCVSPRRPICPVDEWIAIAPGAYGALALSLAHVLARDGLVDWDFVHDHVFGFATWRDQAGYEQPGFEALVRAEYAPDKTKDVTGIPPLTVTRLAHALAEQGPAVVASDASAAAASNGMATAMAMLALNGLLGNLERPGGVWLRREAALSDWAAPTAEPIAAGASAAPLVGTPGCLLARNQAQSILHKHHCRVDVLFLHGADPLATLPDRKAWAWALGTATTVVSFSAWLDETAQQADIVLPVSLPLESWDVVRSAGGTGEPVLSLRQPVIAPLHDTRPVGEFILALAARMGGSFAQSFPWKSYQEAVTARLQGLLDSSAEGDAPEDMKSLLADMKEKGGWWREPAKAGARTGAFPTPSHKFEICSSAIAERMGEAAEAWPCQGLPPWEPPRFSGDPLQFPLQLVPYRPVHFVEDGMRFLPWLSELTLVSGDPWPVRAELNPADAARFGVADGDRVLVESLIGSCEAIAQLSDGVCAGVVAMALGKAGVVDLVVPDEDRWSGAIAWQGTRARVRKLS
jgi:Anaerobic dehydrogenases, typically selenocysteine-containing